jgi:hypothetical protein
MTGKESSDDQKYKNRCATMNENADQMKTPGFEAKKIIIEHAKNGHHRPVEV